MPYNKNLRYQEGTAIFMALLVVTIVTAISITWFTKTRIAIRATQEMLLSEQIHLESDGVLEWAIATLNLDDTVPKRFLSSNRSRKTFISGLITAYRTNHLQTTDDKAYFLLKSELRHDELHILTYSLLHRKTIDGKIVTGVIWQRVGLD